MIKKIFFLFLGIGMIFVIVVLFMFKGVMPIGISAVSNIYIITLTEEGFSPQEIIIHVGDVISFATSRHDLFWPASNLHPTHDIYSEFDPQEPIQPDKKWNFRFDRVGKWQFHDHLAPKYTGIITVRDRNVVSSWGAKKDNLSYLDCATLLSGEKKQCWQDLILSTMEYEGLDRAFEMIASLHEAQSDFRAICHDITHKLGTAAYTLFIAEKDFRVSPKSAYCSFGFYHGFMETLVRSGTDLDSAQAFCRYVDKQLFSETPNAVFSCYHGIGHGLTDLHNKNAWGDEQAMTRPALALCKKIATNEKQLLLCGTGVFDAISLAYYNRLYGMVMKKDDPLWLCREQSDEFKKSCYMDSMPAILWLGNNRLADAAFYVEQFAPKPYADIAIRSLAGNSVRFTIKNGEMNPDVGTCRRLKRSLGIACIEGLAQGVMEFGMPGIEYKKALDFCLGPIILSQEREPCLTRVLAYSSERYSHEKFVEICRTISKSYTHLCTS